MLLVQNKYCDDIKNNNNNTNNNNNNTITIKTEDIF